MSEEYQIVERNREEGSIGIGAMIVFIALILVAAVASTIIIKTAEELQQNAEATSDDTRKEISGKISILQVLVNTSSITTNVADTNIDSLIEGITLVKDGFMQALERNGVHPINPQVDDEFDPTLHEAMLKQDVEGVTPGHVSMVVQAGWAMGSIVLRPAKVALAPSVEDSGES